ncbi:hypothetical protein UlMin_010705 [Ulmus minor]
MAPKLDDIDEYASWPEEIENFFIGLLRDHALKGCAFPPNKKTWQHFERKIFDTYGKRYAVDKLKSKYNRLRRLHREYNHLVDHFSSGWDPDTFTITASDDAWDAYLKNPSAKKYRKKGLANYEMIRQIFNSTTAMGQMAYASSNMHATSEEERQLEQVFLQTGTNTDADESTEEADLGNVSGSVRRSSDITPFDVPMRKDKKMKGEMSAFDMCLLEITKAVSARAEASLVRTEYLQKNAEDRGKKQSDATSNTSDPYSLETCQDILNAMTDLDDASYLKALDKLVAAPEWRGVFVRMSESRRRAWFSTLTS